MIQEIDNTDIEDTEVLEGSESLQDKLSDVFEGTTVLKHITFTGVEMKSIDDEDTFIANVSTNAVDRDGDAIIVSGINTKNYEKNPVVLWAHNHEIPAIGNMVNFKRLKNEFVAKTKFATEPPNLKGDWFPSIINHLIKTKVIKGVSLGFRPSQMRIPSKKDKAEFGPNVKNIIAKCELIEYSIVNVPCNQDALARSLKSYNGNINNEYVQKMFGIDISTKKINKNKEGDEDVIENKDIEKDNVVETDENKIETEHVEQVEKKHKIVLYYRDEDNMKRLLDREIEKELAKKHGKFFIKKR